jgi:predicted RNase H-like nuclease (RuvC/YqgF family)
MAGQTERILAEINSLSTKLDKNTDAVSELKTEVAGMRGECSGCQGRISTCEKGISSLIVELDGKPGESGGLKDRVTKTEGTAALALKFSVGGVLVALGLGGLARYFGWL